MALRLNGSTSGYTEIDAPAAAGSNTLVLPTSNGSAGNILGTDGSGNLSWVNGRMVLGTSQASTSGTSIDFTGIPSWVKRVTVMFDGVSTNGTSNWIVRLGSGSIQSTGYTSGSISAVGAGNTAVYSINAFVVNTNVTNAETFSGHCVVTKISGNTWVSSCVLFGSSVGGGMTSAGSVTLSGTLDQLRITTLGGGNTFDAGSINILYEG